MSQENGTFTLLIFSCNAGMGIETRKFFQHVSELVVEKHHQNVSENSAWINPKLSFCLLRTAVIFIRGSWSQQHVAHISEKGEIDTRNIFSSITD